jgi:hypothetical protein
MVYLTNQYVWGSALAGLIALYAGASYINGASKLSRYIDEHYSELWEKIFGGFWLAGSSDYNFRRRARRLEWLVLFNSGSRNQPDDAEFHRLLGETRWAAAIFLFAFVTAIVLLATADANIHPPH